MFMFFGGKYQNSKYFGLIILWLQYLSIEVFLNFPLLWRQKIIRKRSWDHQIPVLWPVHFSRPFISDPVFKINPKFLIWFFQDYHEQRLWKIIRGSVTCQMSYGEKPQLKSYPTFWVSKDKIIDYFIKWVIESDSYTSLNLTHPLK